MDRVLAAIDASPCTPSVVQIARSIAEWFDATVTILHARENGSDAPLESAHSAEISLCDASSPIDTILAAAEEPDVVAVVLGARRDDRGPKPVGHTALDVIYLNASTRSVRQTRSGDGSRRARPPST